jgi:hypothetical protein
MKSITLAALALALVGCHSLDHYVQPFGKGMYRIDDGDAVAIANKYCARSGLAMQPAEQGGGWTDRNVFEFRCVAKDALTASDVHPRQ